MIRILAIASLVLWVQLFNTGLQLNLYLYEHNSPLAQLTLRDQTAPRRPGLPTASLQRDTCSVWKATETLFTILSEPDVLEHGEERKRGTETDEKRREAGQRRWPAGSRGVPLNTRKVCPVCPSSQNGGERSAAWQPSTIGTFTGGRP